MKTIIWLMLCCVLVSSVFADTNVDINIEAGGDMDAHIGLEAGGDLDVTIDGLNFDESISNLNNRVTGSGTKKGTVHTWISRLFMKMNSNKEWYVVDANDIRTYHGSVLRFVFDTYFVPRSELYNIINMQQEQINQLSLEIKTLQKLHDETEICNNRLELAKEMELEYVYCGEIKYWNYQGDKFLIIN